MINSRFEPTFNLEKLPTVRTGLVTDFNTTSFTADVKLEGSEFLTAVPVLGMYGTTYGSDMVWLQNLRGAVVLLILVDGSYHILSTVPQLVKQTNTDTYKGTIPETEASTTVTDVRKTLKYQNFNPNRPTSITPGDKVLRAEGGAEVGVLRGGIIRLKAASMAQIIMGKFRDFVRIVSRRFQIFSDFGEVDFFHAADGKVGLNIKGGASYMDETHPEVDKYTVLLSMGHCESDETHRLYVEVRSADGEAMSKCSLAADGKADMWSKGDLTIKTEAKVSVEAAADVSIDAGGAVDLKAAGSVTITGSKISLN